MMPDYEDDRILRCTSDRCDWQGPRREASNGMFGGPLCPECRPGSTPVEPVNEKSETTDSD